VSGFTLGFAVDGGGCGGGYFSACVGCGIEDSLRLCMVVGFNFEG
jgi:hypothetical protein